MTSAARPLLALLLFSSGLVACGENPSLNDAGPLADAHVTTARDAPRPQSPVDAATPDAPRPPEADDAALPPDAAIPRFRCDEGPVVVHATTAGAYPRSLASNRGRWALTYVTSPTDGGFDTTYLAVFDSDGLPIAAPRPVELLARVVALGDGFLLVGPSLAEPLFVLLDASGVERARLVDPALLPPGLDTSASVTRLEATPARCGSVVMLVATSTRSRTVLSVRGTGDRSLAIDRLLDLPLAPSGGASAIGLCSDEILEVSALDDWMSLASAHVYRRDPSGEFVEALDVPAWAEGPTHVASAVRIDDGWRVVGGSRDPDSRFVRGRIVELYADGTSGTPLVLGEPGTSAEADGADYRIPSAIVSGEDGISGFVLASSFGIVNASGAISRFDAGVRVPTYDDPLLAFDPNADRFATVGRTSSGLVLRCDLRGDGAHGAFAGDPHIVPPDASDADATPPSPGPGPCTATTPLVVAASESGIAPIDVVVTDEVIALTHTADIGPRVLILDRAGVVRGSRDSVYPALVETLGAGILVIEGTEAVLLSQADGSVIARVALPLAGGYGYVTHLAPGGAISLAVTTGAGASRHLFVRVSLDPGGLSASIEHVTVDAGPVIALDPSGALLPSSRVAGGLVELRRAADGAWSERDVTAPLDAEIATARWGGDGWVLILSEPVPGTWYRRVRRASLPADSEIVRGELFAVPALRQLISSRAKILAGGALLLRDHLFSRTHVVRPTGVESLGASEGELAAAEDPRGGAVVLYGAGGTLRASTWTVDVAPSRRLELRCGIE